MRCGLREPVGKSSSEFHFGNRTFYRLLVQCPSILCCQQHTFNLYILYCLLVTSLLESRDSKYHANFPVCFVVPQNPLNVDYCVRILTQYVPSVLLNTKCALTVVCPNGGCFFSLYGFRPLACTSSEFAIHCRLQTFRWDLWTGDRPLLRPVPPQVNTERYGGGGVQGMGLFASSVFSLPSQDVQKIMSPGCVLSSMQDVQVLFKL